MRGGMPRDVGGRPNVGWQRPADDARGNERRCGRDAREWRGMMNDDDDDDDGVSQRKGKGRGGGLGGVNASGFGRTNGRRSVDWGGVGGDEEGSRGVWRAGGWMWGRPVGGGVVRAVSDHLEAEESLWLGRGFTGGAAAGGRGALGREFASPFRRSLAHLADLSSLSNSDAL